MEQYGKKVRFFVYNSSNLNQLDAFSSNSGINVMIINMQAFNTSMKEGGRSKEARIIYDKRDEFGSRRPIDVIKANNPIIILDEPQKMGGDATQKALQNFNPLFCLNYSATHKEHHNLVYALDAVDAYNQRLVKRIEVKGFQVKNFRGTDKYLYLESIIVSPKHPPRARIEFEVKYDKSINREMRILGVDDNLYELSKNMEQYRGYRISEIDPIMGSVTFTNGEVIHKGDVVGDISEKDMRRIQIRETIISHMEKEEELFNRGIKTLSLFFIDEVAKYRVYDEDGTELLGEYGKMFEEEYRDVVNNYITIFDTPYQRYLKGIEVEDTHKGYFRTIPAMFTEIEEFEYEGKLVIAISVEADGKKYTTTDGRCLKRLGRNSKPMYPEELSNVYSSVQNPDFSGRIVSESTLDDVNRLEVYSLKEKLRVRDSKSTLPDLEDKDFLRDLQLIKYDGDVERLTIAGLLFVGKESSIQRLFPQAEVIYLHYSADNPEEYDARLDLKLPMISVIDKLTERVKAYSKIENVQVGLFRLEVEEFSERVFQEALLNAMSHRDYQSNAAVYVKHYPDKIVIENPGGFLDGITEKNIITHPSAPRNKLIAETLQNLKYVQRTGQGVDIIFREMVSMGKPYPRYTSFDDAVSLTIYSAIDNTKFVKFITEEQDKNSKIMSLAEMMILRSLLDNRKEQLASLADIVQKSIEETKKSCSELVNKGLIEIVGKDYMLTAKVYEALKSDVEYTRDKTIQYIKAKNMILEYLQSNDSITSTMIQEMCGFTKQQARIVIDKMREEQLIMLQGKGPAARYIRKSESSYN